MSQIDAMAKQLDEAYAEIERIKYHYHALEAAYKNAIEECARVADGFGDKYYFMSAVEIAAAVRALKDKP